MIRREVVLPVELYDEISAIVYREGYVALMDAFPKGHSEARVFLSQDEAEAVIDLVVIEKKKARLKFPFHDDEHPQFSAEHEAKFDDVQMGLYEKTIFYVESAFGKGRFDRLL